MIDKIWAVMRYLSRHGLYIDFVCVRGGNETIDFSISASIITKREEQETRPSTNNKDETYPQVQIQHTPGGFAISARVLLQQQHAIFLFPDLFYGSRKGPTTML